MNSLDTLEPIPDAFFNPLYEKMYYVTDGMPEYVLMWTKERDVSAMQEVLSNIITAYELAFKLYLVDVGLLRRLSMLSPSAFGEGNRLFHRIQGSINRKLHFSNAFDTV